MEQSGNAHIKAKDMNAPILLNQPVDLTHSKRLRAAMRSTHERLDKAIMGVDPFGSWERYILFLQVQHDFHRAVDVFYRRWDLRVVTPDLAERRRLDLIRQDIAALGGTPAALGHRDDHLVDVPVALGWLYVAEGSNMGTAFLLKWAKGKLGLTARRRISPRMWWRSSAGMAISNVRAAAREASVWRPGRHDRRRRGAAADGAFADRRNTGRGGSGPRGVR